MAKGQGKRQRKYLREAADARRQRSKALVKLVIAVAIAVALWAIYSFTPTNNTMLSSALVFLAALVIVVIIGEIGVKYSKWNTEYNKLKNTYGLDDASIKEQMKKDKRGQ